MGVAVATCTARSYNMLQVIIILCKEEKVDKLHSYRDNHIVFCTPFHFPKHLN